MFVWRLAHNSLANRMKIHKLGIDLDTKCPVCNRLNEDGGHVFLKCKKAKTCWIMLGVGELREKLLVCASPRALLQEIWNCNEITQVRAVTLTWEWWNFHNKPTLIAAVIGPFLIAALLPAVSLPPRHRPLPVSRTYLPAASSLHHRFHGHLPLPLTATPPPPHRRPQ